MRRHSYGMLTAVARASCRAARQLGIPDDQIVQGLIDATLLAMIREAEEEDGRQLVLVLKTGPWMAPGSDA